MSDNKSMVGEPDRSRVAASERYEVEHFASRHGITPDEAKQLIEQFGNQRDVLDRESTLR